MGSGVGWGNRRGVCPLHAGTQTWEAGGGDGKARAAVGGETGQGRAGKGNHGD